MPINWDSRKTFDTFEEAIRYHQAETPEMPINWVKVLRDLADNIEGADMPAEITIFEHYEKVTDPEMGGAVVDAKWYGRSIVIHIGVADHMILAKRLIDAART